MGKGLHTHNTSSLKRLKIEQTFSDRKKIVAVSTRGNKQTKNDNFPFVMNTKIGYRLK